MSERFIPEEYLVGAHKNKDGSWDTSRAMKMRPPAEGNQDAESEQAESMVFINPIEGGKEGTQGQGRETRTEVIISNKQLIHGSLSESSGAFGTVYTVDVTLPAHAGKKYKFVLKEMLDIGDNTENALSNHRAAKKAGLKVWKTYRISEDKHNILMSTGQLEGWEVLHGNILDEEPVYKPIPEFTNFELFLTDYYAQALKATQNSININADVPFIMVREDEIDFVLGDVDQLEVVATQNKTLLAKNLQSMHFSLRSHLENVYGATASGRYIDSSRDYIKSIYGVEVVDYSE
ncbi:MAG: hypothetical protein IT410_04340 [Candidatus Doudnabacteria bacterium]|nr:hypothetical protein [Candidatus Doudnabacteria bacterium]